MRREARRHRGSPITGVSGGKKPTSAPGVNAKSAGVGEKGEAARQASPSKDVANARPATGRRDASRTHG